MKLKTEMPGEGGGGGGRKLKLRFDWYIICNAVFVGDFGQTACYAFYNLFRK